MHAVRWLCLILAIGLPPTLHVHAQTNAAASSKPPGGADYRPWPRSFDVNGIHLELHHPQMDSWVGNQLKGRLAVAVRKGTQVGSDGKSHDVMTYGVAWFSARTDTDKAQGQVTLSSVTIDKVAFPADVANEGRYRDALAQIAGRSKQVANLDTLEASLAIRHAEDEVKNVSVRNDPPQIIFSFGPALLVLIDGTPVSRPTGTTGVDRVVNTRSLLLQQGGAYYLTYAGRWVKASSLQGPWTSVATPPSAVTTAARAVIQAKEADALDQPSDALKQVLASGKQPDIVVSTKPAELLMVEGEPQFVAIPGTQLAYVANTGADVFVDQGHGMTWYALISGRWFTADSTQGPWRYVAGKALPADFARIPSDSPKSAVLASIPGTPEAGEALISNSIPQTATVDSRTAQLHVSYDGQPQFRPIEGTTLTYAWNTPVPVIRVPAGAYYAVQNGVWFTAAAAEGPWTVALDVPAVIYTIPPSSPLYYVTYVYVYGHDGNQVYVGYSPGYYGTVVSDNVVVYGTGYACNPWIGDDWYGCPTTYGFGVSFGWAPWAGWSYGYAWGWPWAAAWYGPWWGPWWGYGPGYYPGYWGGAIAAANVYGRWGNSVVAGRGVAWANPWTGNAGRAVRGGYANQVTGGRGAGYAGRNTNVYTGNTTAAAGGIRYNPQTGRVVAGQGGAVGNIYTGNGVAGGTRTTVNTNTGRVTQQAGVAGRTETGAGAAGAFNSQGAAGEVRGAGYVQIDRTTGEVSRGGVVDYNDNVYAGKNGDVYRYDGENGWQKVDPKGNFDRVQQPDSVDTNRDRLARDRSVDSSVPTARSQRSGGQQFDRSNYNRSYGGRMGGYRPSMGGGRFGGGGRMGGGRGR